MRIMLNLGGSQTDIHCSTTSSINACGKLTSKGNCTLFKTKLEYDYDEHAYKRCKKCIESEEK